MALTQFTLPGTRAVGDPNPPGDMNQVVNAANATGSIYNVLNATYSGGADPTGVADSTAAFQAAITAAAATGGAVGVPPGSYLYSSTLDLSNTAGMVGWGANQSFGIPIANYGVSGLALQGAILVASNSFANPNSGTGTILLTQSTTQGGGQRIQNISLDCSNLPNGNNLHGILIQNNIACVTLRDVTVYGGSRQLGGDCLHCVSSGGSPPDLLDIAFCHFAGATGYGVTMSGVADTYVTATESTANGSGAWNIINGNNTRFIGCKGETSNAGPGWLFTANSGFTGVVHIIGCTSQGNNSDGFKFTGTGTGTYQMIACSDDGSGTNGGAGGGGFSGLNVNEFAGICLATGWNSRVGASPVAPQYGVSMSTSATLTLQGGANVAGSAATYFNGGGNTSFIGTTAPGGFLCAPTQYAPGSLVTFTSTSATFAVVSSSNINTGSFSAPPSGSVRVEASFVGSQATGNSAIGFTLANHGGTTPVCNAWQPTLANTSVNQVMTLPFLVTGLTAGSAYTFDLMFATNTTGDALSVLCEGFSAGTVSSVKAGPVIMSVQAV